MVQHSEYLCDLITKQRSVRTRRAKDCYLLSVPPISKSCANSFCERSFMYAAPYMDQLSIRLNRSGIGGDIGGHLINHLCYADDLCLISLSSAGMQ